MQLQWHMQASQAAAAAADVSEIFKHLMLSVYVHNKLYMCKMRMWCIGTCLTKQKL